MNAHHAPICPRAVATLALALPLLIATAGAPAAGAQTLPATQSITITGTEFALTPNTITLTAGQPVVLTVTNGGQLDHDVKSDIPISALTYLQADNPPDEQAENSAAGEFDVDYNVGDASTVSFVPTTPGVYQFWCDVPGHKMAGMVGTFTVVAPDAQTDPAAGV